MQLPKGNRVMPEGLKLSSADLTNAAIHLSADKFSGYLQFELPEGKEGVIFFSQGSQVRALERQGTSVRLARPERLINKVGPGGGASRSYLLSPPLASALAFSFGFEPMHDGAVPKREFKPILDQLEQDGSCGFVRFSLPDRQAVLVLDSGELINDTFVDNYGEVVCGREQITALLDSVHAEGARIGIYAAKRSELDRRARKLHADLERTVQLTPKPISGLFASKDTLKLDFEFVRTWGLPPKATFQLVVEDLEGRRLGVHKCQGAAGKSQQLDVPAKILASWGVGEGQQVAAYPDSE
jgi:hypothetical protein